MGRHELMPGESWCRGCGKPFPCPTAERDRLRDAIEAIPRHVPYDVGAGEFTHCVVCEDPGGWPCPTEQAHRLIAATPLSASAEDRAATDGAGSRLPHGEGPHDGRVEAQGTLPAPKDTTEEARP